MLPKKAPLACCLKVHLSLSLILAIVVTAAAQVPSGNNHLIDFIITIIHALNRTQEFNFQDLILHMPA